MYFQNFPKIYYAFEYRDGMRLQIVRDITLNLRPVKEILENVMYYEDYDIADGDTPEIIAEKLYGDPLLHWVILLTNERYHYLKDFPVPEEFFEEYLANIYGPSGGARTHSLYGRPHYLSPSGRVVDSNYPLARAVSNREYEAKVNQAKRRIRIVNPRLIGMFVQNLQEAFPSE